MGGAKLIEILNEACVRDIVVILRASVHIGRITGIKAKMGYTVSYGENTTVELKIYTGFHISS